MRLRTGDLIFVHDMSFSGILSMLRFGSWWTHAAMYYGEGKTAEMTDKNFRMLTFKKRYAAKKIMVVRFKWVGPRQRKALKLHAQKLSKVKFDRLRLVVPLLPQFRKNRAWCTTFIDLVYRIATRVPVNTATLMREDRKYMEFYKAVVVSDYRGR